MKIFFTSVMAVVVISVIVCWGTFAEIRYHHLNMAAESCLDRKGESWAPAQSFGSGIECSMEVEERKRTATCTCGSYTHVETDWNKSRIIGDWAIQKLKEATKGAVEGFHKESDFK